VQYLVVDEEISTEWRGRLTNAGVELVIAYKNDDGQRGASEAAK
jgi:hypothetical protein